MKTYGMMLTVAGRSPFVLVCAGGVIFFALSVNRELVYVDETWTVDMN